MHINFAEHQIIDVAVLTRAVAAGLNVVRRRRQDNAGSIANGR
jgi:hypothetical protein